MEEMLTQILEKLDVLQADAADLKSDVAELKSTTNRIEKRQEAIFEQTAGLAEFQTEVKTSLKEIKSLRTDIATIEAVTGKNMQDIAHLKAVK